jgi:hypothetical protein
MANTIQLRRSATANAVPTTTQLALGELAINTTDGKLYLKKNVSGVETIIDVTGGGASISVSDTAPASPINGAMWFDSTNASLKVFYIDQNSGQWVATSGPVGQAGFDPIVVNDISTQFDGTKSIFELRVDQDYIGTVVDSKDLEVIVNGSRLTPYVAEIKWPWFSPYDSFQGFRVLNGVSEPNTVKLALYNAPFIGDSASVIKRAQSSSQQQRRYPFSVSTIALGD